MAVHGPYTAPVSYGVVQSPCTDVQDPLEFRCTEMFYPGSNVLGESTSVHTVSNRASHNFYADTFFFTYIWK